MRHLRPACAVLVCSALLALAGCSGASSGAEEAGPRLGDWSSVLSHARGQALNWYMYGGDATLNSFVDDYVAPRLQRRGITLNQVKVADTGDALNRMLAEKQAGRTSGGAVDAVWVNGENFATGAQAGLWYCGWPRTLPHARYVDFSDPAVTHDFGVPVDGCESVWQQADSALVYDSAKLDRADVASISSLFAWARHHPGRFTYPAPPDFTGSMVVRTILEDTVTDPKALRGRFAASTYAPAARRLWARLNHLRPALWRGGETYPQSQGQVEQLFASGQISAYFTYGPGAVGQKVEQGRYPATTRQAVPSVGNIANDSFLGIPAAASHRAAALVLANLLQAPDTQLALYRREGIYPGIDVARTRPAMQRHFASVSPSPAVLPLTRLTRHTIPELASGYVTRLERDWKRTVLQR